MKLKLFILLGLGLFLNSCYPLGPYIPPKIKFCYFDPVSKSIISELKDSGMVAYIIMLYNYNNERAVCYSRVKFPKPVDKISLATLDTSLFLKNTIHIYISYDYNYDDQCVIKIKPADWKRRRKVFSRDSRIY